jgi:hypothetical protein
MIDPCQASAGMAIGEWLSMSEKGGSVCPRRVAQNRRNLHFVYHDEKPVFQNVV